MDLQVLICLLFSLGIIHFADSKECYFCTSNAFEHCNNLNVSEDKETVIQVTCVAEDDFCFTKIGPNNTIARGCLLEMRPHAKRYLSTLKNSTTFKYCSTPLCNSDPVAKDDCYKCDSNTDQNCKSGLSEETKMKCPVTIGNRGCFHFDDGNRVRRGCVSDADDVCQQNTDVCKTCFGGNCNSKTSFQKCVSCESIRDPQLFLYLMSDPQKCVSKMCENYSDSCFTHIENRIIRRGCLHDSVEPFNKRGIDVIRDCRNEYKCRTCSGKDNCNEDDPPTEVCIDCDSQVNPNCSSAPDWQMQKECKLTMKLRGCYLQRSGSNDAKRGCVSDLTDLNRRQNDHGKNFKTCIGHNCNLRNFQSCRMCNSRDSPKCAAKASEAVFSQLCKGYTVDCFTHVANDVVTRGCIGEDIADENCMSGNCKRCSNGTACNNDALVREECITCDSSVDPTCQAIAAFTQCPLDFERKGCYHFINETTGQHKRGCVNELLEAEKQQLSMNHNNFKTCFGSRCNSRPEFTKCVACSSSTDRNCIGNHEPIEAKTCQIYVDKCFSFTHNNNVQRGCLKEMNPGFASECEAKRLHCETCESNNGTACNNRNLALDTCIECDSNVDRRCRDSTELIEEKICSVKANNTGCYLDKRNGSYKRGCLEDLVVLQQTQRVECGPIEISELKSCYGKNCNVVKDFRTCYACNSLTDANCALVSNSTEGVVCTNYVSSCVTGIEKDFTYRNCSEKPMSKLTMIGNDWEECDSDKCNDIIFPRNRLQCHQCSGGSECNTLLTNATLAPCRRFSKIDECYTFIDDDKRVHRGCISDESRERLKCGESKDRCLKCCTNGCNGQSVDSKEITGTSDSSSSNLTAGFLLIVVLLVELL